MPDDVLKSLSKSDDSLFPKWFTLRDEANAIAVKAFRNGPLGQLHAGEYSPLLEDPTLSRITNASEVVEELLRWKETYPERYAHEILWFNTHDCKGWKR